MIAAVDIDNVQGVDFIEVVLGDVGGKHIGGAWIETGAQQRHQPRLFKFVLIGPLPAVLELGGIQRLVVGGIHIIDARFQTGIHNGQILIGQRHIDHQIRFDAIDQRHQFRHVVRIYLGGLNGPIELRGNVPTFRFSATGEDYLLKDIRQLGALVGHNATDPTGTDNEYFCHA